VAREREQAQIRWCAESLCLLYYTKRTSGHKLDTHSALNFDVTEYANILLTSSSCSLHFAFVIVSIVEKSDMQSFYEMLSTKL
jgi:hypothetical protein